MLVAFLLGAEVTFVGPLSGNVREVKIKKNDVELTIRYDKRIFGGEDSELLALEVGDIVNYIGNLGWFNNPQLGYGLTHLSEKENLNPKNFQLLKMQ